MMERSARRKKMFVLVFWSDDKTTSVLSEGDIKEGKKNGTLGKWGSKFYPLTILKRSEDEETLNSMKVMTDGRIWTSAMENLATSQAERRKLLKNERLRKKSKMATKNNYQATLSTTKTIFSDFEDDDTVDIEETHRERAQSALCAIDSQGNREQIAKKSEEEELENGKRKKDDRNAMAEKEKTDTVDIAKTHGERAQCALCARFPLEFLREMIDHVEHCQKQVRCVSADIHPDNPDHSTILPTPKVISSKKTELSGGQVPLLPSSSVLVYDRELEIIKKLYRRDPAEMVRKLMKQIFDDKILNMTRTGRNQTEGIPKHVYRDVFCE